MHKNYTKQEDNRNKFLSCEINNYIINYYVVDFYEKYFYIMYIFYFK